MLIIAIKVFFINYQQLEGGSFRADILIANSCSTTLLEVPKWA